MMDKITITNDEIAQVSVTAPPPKKARLIPLWIRILSSLLILFPPLLFILTLAVLPSIRKRPLALKHAWAVQFCCLLVASGILWMVVALIIGLAGPPPPEPEESAGLTLTSFPAVPSSVALSAKDIANQLRPLVLIVHSPRRRFPFSRRPLLGPRMGAAALIHANSKGCIAVTSRHVVDALGTPSQGLGRVLAVADENGQWASACLIGRHRDLDLALLWIERENGTNSYTQPIRRFSAIDVGDHVFAIGHPEGLDFSMSTGIISQKRGDDLLQVSAPVSPGNSGGPVFDEHGLLLGIVQSVIDKKVSPNAENLNFAVRAGALLDSLGWDLDARGEKAIEALRLGGEAVTQRENAISRQTEQSHY